MSDYSPRRRAQVDELMLQELSALTAREIEFPTGALATFTRVIVDPEMKQARILFTALPDSMVEEVFTTLKRQRGFLQHLLNRRLSMQHVPDIFFERDTGEEEQAEQEVASIESLIDRVSREIRESEKAEQKEDSE